MRMLRSSTILALALVVVGCQQNSDATDSSVASHFESPEVEGRRYREAFTDLDEEYCALAERRREAYMLRDSARRSEALALSDSEALHHSEVLRHTDSAWLATARHFYMLGDGSFTRLCDSYSTDSASLSTRLLRL